MGSDTRPQPSSPPARRRRLTALGVFSALGLAGGSLLAGNLLAGTVRQSSGPASATSAPGGRVLWAGDAETGNLSQWASAVRVAPDRIRVVRWPVRQGRYAYRFEVRQGDDPTPEYSPDDRAELGQSNPGRGPLIDDGADQWYGFSVRFDKNFPDASWQVFAQWKQVGPNPPPGGMSADDDMISFDMGGSDKGLPGHGGTLFRTRLVRGVWSDFVVHVKWSPDPTVGFVALWYDGRQVVRRTYTANMYRNADGEVIPNAARIGYYRYRGISPTGVLYIDAYKAGTSYSAVVP